jgi:hypothetical protein
LTGIIDPDEAERFEAAGVGKAGVNVAESPLNALLDKMPASKPAEPEEHYEADAEFVDDTEPVEAP